MQRGWAGALFFLFFFLDIRVRGIGFLCLLQGFDHGVQRGIEDDGRMAERIQLRRFPARAPCREKDRRDGIPW